MHAWVAVTLAAAAVQTLRFLLQKRLKSIGLSTGGATFSRFLFGAPFALSALAILVASGEVLHAPPLSFWAFVLLGGLCQIIATFATVALFSERSFVVGIAFTKSETIMVAVFSALILDEAVPAIGVAAILVGTLGVVLLSRPAEGWGQVGLFNRATGLGLLAGAFFGLSSIGYRGATLAVDAESALFRAVVALAAVTTCQTIAMRGWLAWREPGEAGRVLRAWRSTALVGLAGVTGSLGWFVAFALMNAAYVRSLGQVELIFSLAVSMLFFHEKVSLRELLGIGLLAAGIVGIVIVA
jgi:drug/metabolite transporter (DMT)-like permease